MSDLDKKLEETLAEYDNESQPTFENDPGAWQTAHNLKNIDFAREHAVAKIKQAFIDEGWIPSLGIVAIGNKTLLMTGIEFYDRLREKLEEFSWTQDEKDSILQAAFEVSNEATAAPDLLTKDQWEQQAIKDGWICVPEIYRGKNVVLHANGAESFIRYDGKPVMTGQEWFDKFKVEMKKAPGSLEALDSLLMLAIAKKAAGIS